MVDRLVNSEANARRIALVESCFGTAGQPLAVPGRVLVGEGVLTKACRKKPKPRQFFLFNDLLVYGNIIISKKKYNKQHIIPLEEVKLRSLEDEGIFMNGWLICARGKSFAVYAATATEKQEWMAHIEKCVKDLIEKSGKKPPSESERAAVWVPDTAAPNCMVCKKVQFTMLNRRHHCRKCGQVVCGGCSSHKALLPHMSSKPVRVCDECYRALSTRSTDGRNNFSAERLNSDSSSEDSDDEEEGEQNGVDQAECSSFPTKRWWNDSEDADAADAAADDCNGRLVSALSQLGPPPRARDLGKLQPRPDDALTAHE